MGQNQGHDFNQYLAEKLSFHNQYGYDGYDCSQNVQGHNVAQVSRPFDSHVAGYNQEYSHYLPSSRVTAPGDHVHLQHSPQPGGSDWYSNDQQYHVNHPDIADMDAGRTVDGTNSQDHGNNIQFAGSPYTKVARFTAPAVPQDLEGAINAGQEPPTFGSGGNWNGQDYDPSFPPARVSEYLGRAPPQSSFNQSGRSQNEGYFIEGTDDWSPTNESNRATSPNTSYPIAGQYVDSNGRQDYGSSYHGPGSLDPNIAPATITPLTSQDFVPQQHPWVPNAGLGVPQASGSGPTQTSSQNTQPPPSTQQSRRAKGRRTNGVPSNSLNVRVVDPAGPWLELYDPATGNWDAAVRHADIRDRLLWESDQIATQHGGYDFEPAAGIDPTDRTSFVPAHKDWGPARPNRPEINFFFERPKHALPPHIQPNTQGTKWVWHGYIVLDHNGIPMRDFPDCPTVLSAAVEGFRLDAIQKRNPDIKTNDFWARLPPQHTAISNGRQKTVGLMTVPQVTNVTYRWRHKACIMAWSSRAGTEDTRAFLWEFLTPQQRRQNTTRGREDLTPLELKELERYRLRADAARKLGLPVPPPPPRVHQVTTTPAIPATNNVVGSLGHVGGAPPPPRVVTVDNVNNRTTFMPNVAQRPIQNQGPAPLLASSNDPNNLGGRDHGTNAADSNASNDLRGGSPPGFWKHSNENLRSDDDLPFSMQDDALRAACWIPHASEESSPVDAYSAHGQKRKRNAELPDDDGWEKGHVDSNSNFVEQRYSATNDAVGQVPKKLRLASGLPKASPQTGTWSPAAPYPLSPLRGSETIDFTEKDQRVEHSTQPTSIDIDGDAPSPNVDSVVVGQNDLTGNDHSSPAPEGYRVAPGYEPVTFPIGETITQFSPDEVTVYQATVAPSGGTVWREQAIADTIRELEVAEATRGSEGQMDETTEEPSAVHEHPVQTEDRFIPVPIGSQAFQLPINTTRVCFMASDRKVRKAIIAPNDQTIWYELTRRATIRILGTMQARRSHSELPAEETLEQPTREAGARSQSRPCEEQTPEDRATKAGSWGPLSVGKASLDGEGGFMVPASSDLGLTPPSVVAAFPRQDLDERSFSIPGEQQQQAEESIYTDTDLELLANLDPGSPAPVHLDRSGHGGAATQSILPEQTEKQKEVVYATIRETGQSLEAYTEAISPFSQAHKDRCDCEGRCTKLEHYHPELAPTDDTLFTGNQTVATPNLQFSMCDCQGRCTKLEHYPPELASIINHAPFTGDEVLSMTPWASYMSGNMNAKTVSPGEYLHDDRYCANMLLAEDEFPSQDDDDVIW